ncbi:hypothetical protein OHA72_32855 [Dactylosporangium sp. NBC_01737]|uniref:hypothetical protein n=1 Tax=Dactylosporangium sp. NBC_01737 TaxID=2975959 RepID=UPI002E1601EB|nr:hypothetical protein OHA72_32855 [Dactylosporangium sp. NBC_01737]
MAYVTAAAALTVAVVIAIAAVARKRDRGPQTTSRTGSRGARSARCRAEIDRLVSDFIAAGRGERPRRFRTPIKASFPPPAHREWRHLHLGSSAGWLCRDSTFVLAVGRDGDWAFVGTYFYRSGGKQHPESWPVSRERGFQSINEYEITNAASGYVEPEQVVECFRTALRKLSAG